MIVTFSHNAAAEEVLVDPNARSVLSPQQRATEIIAVDAQGVMLDVPVGYLSPRLTYDQTSSVTQTSDQPLQIGALSFAFWMPSLRWPEHDRISTPDFRPTEHLDAGALRNEYVVEAKLVRPWSRGGGGSLPRTPEEKTLAGLELGLQLLDGKTIEHRLVRYGRPDTQPFTYYGNIAGDDLQIELRCRSAERAPNPLCHGDVLWPHAGLGLELTFSLEDLSHWRANVEAARVLVEGWRQTALDRK